MKGKLQWFLHNFERLIMKSIVKKISLCIFSLFLLTTGCKKDVEIPDSSSKNTDITFSVPQGWPAPYYNFKNNQLTNAGFALGRKLFYDTRLSRDNSVSCGSCHQSFAAFAQADHVVSHGVDDLLGTRNSPGLFNLNWNTSFMWDGGINHIEVQPLGPIANPVEMDENIGNVLVKLNNDAQYKKMFQDAFGSSEITSEKLLKSMAQFMGAMVSSNAKYDKVSRKENGISFTESEQAGLTIFENKCATCHTAPLFTDHSFRNIGLKPNSINDSGRAHITRDANDLYKFKVPTLRNLSYTAPYGHDGRFNTLDQVFDQMEKDIYSHPTVDPLMTSGIKLSATERENLKAFLKTLDDETFVKDKRFAEPSL